MKPTTLVMTCEHAGNDIPPAYQHLFKDNKAVLNTHRGIDLGAMDIFNYLADRIDCDTTHTTISRLLIDCNRSLNNPHCFSEFSQTLSSEEKQTVIDTYYKPYRLKAEQLIQTHIAEGKQVLHLSVHSFTPVLNGQLRNAAIGLLYDPKRHGEKEVARLMHHILSNHPTAYHVRLNYPYKGVADGFTSALRKKYSEKDYLGIELESNQQLVSDKKSFQHLAKTLALSLKELLQLL